MPAADHPRRLRSRGHRKDEAEDERAAEEVAERAAEQPDGPTSARSSALAGVRLHRDEPAAQLTRALGAQALTSGSDIFWSQGAPDLNTTAGRRLLAHELAHVVQQRHSGPGAQFFRASEKPQIAPDLAAMMAVIDSIVTASSRSDGGVNMDELVQRAGGRTAGQALPAAVRSDPTPAGMYGLTYRYLFTRRAGLIDLRHFLQLLYIAWFTAAGNPQDAARGATRRGIEHEETSEPESKFGGEDLTSNALGAYTATRLAALPQRADLIARIRETLTVCAPVTFTALSAASQDSVVGFYATLTGAGEPLNANRTAVALIPSIPELAGQDRSFPYELDTDDDRRATLVGPTFAGGAASLAGDSDIRSFVATQRDEALIGLSASEVVRMCRRLLQGWVSDDDLDAFAKLFRLGPVAARSTLRASLNPSDLGSPGQRTRLRLLLSGSG